MRVGLWHLLWTLPTSELVTLASCGHTVTGRSFTSGKIKLYRAFKIPNSLLVASHRTLLPQPQEFCPLENRDI